jgi:hypothetical protein
MELGKVVSVPVQYERAYVRLPPFVFRVFEFLAADEMVAATQTRMMYV